MSDAIRTVQSVRIRLDGFGPITESGRVVVEQAVSIAIEGLGNYTVMCTPCDTDALAVGFAFSEGLITGLEDVAVLSRCKDDPRVIHMRLESPPRGVSVRNLIVTSACGLCGSRSIEETLSGLRSSGDSLRVSGSFLVSMAEKMRSMQTIFAQSGGTHAAAIFDSGGGIVAFAEDIGRHNALDKAIGKCLLAKVSTRGKGVVLSGRISLELVLKAARAGVEVIAAVSAPSSLAVEVAGRCNITLCGFVREDRATIYTHPKRITEVG